ncbi:MAG TPA: gliding motility-associated protein GldE, partial [Chitinophagaceae bacterium]
LLLEKPRTVLATLLITSTLMNIGIILLCNFLMDQLFGAGSSLVITFIFKVLVIAGILLLFSQVLPKIYATQNNIRMALFAAPVVSALNSIFDPVSNLLVSSSNVIERNLNRRNSANVSLEEIDEAIELSVDESASQEEKNILRGIVKFGNITAKQIMRTRLDVSGISYTASFLQVIKRVSELHYSRLPVFKESLDNIVGIVHTKDLLPHLQKEQQYDWHDAIRQPYFVHEHKLIEDLMKEFQLKHIHFAIVVDEFGGTSGIVTLEDIMEEIIGDIKDEFDEEEFNYNKINEHSYVFEGKTMLNDVCRIMNIAPDTFEAVKGESDSLGGLILELAGEFPEVNSVISYGNFDFTVLEITRMRIQKVKVTLNSDTFAGGQGIK